MCRGPGCRYDGRRLRLLIQGPQGPFFLSGTALPA
jgi:hypothetical protein